MNSIFDLNEYDDFLEVKGYDLFINQKGKIFKVKKMGSNETNHNSWAEKYIEKINLSKNSNYNVSLVDLLAMIKLNSNTEILVHAFGFVYYSHESLQYTPVIKFPNPVFLNKKVSNKQLSTLTSIMLINNENPFLVPMIMGEEEAYNYVEIETKKR